MRGLIRRGGAIGAGLLLTGLLFASGVAAPKAHAVASSHAAYVFDFGSGLNDPLGPVSGPPGSSIFRNAITATGLADGSFYNGVLFTNVAIASIDANPANAFVGFDTVILYQVCSIGTHPLAVAAVNAFLDTGGKVLIFDGDACAPTSRGGRGTADYSLFRFPFATNSPGPQGAGGSYTFVEASSLTSGLPAPGATIQADAVGDANVFTSNAGGWCASIKAKNVNGATGFVEAYARTLAGGLVIYEGEDFWFTFVGRSGFGALQAHLKQVFDLMLAQPFRPDNLPCTNPPSGIKLDPASDTKFIGTPQTLTATVVNTDAQAQAGVTVKFVVASGPDAGLTATGVTDSSGHATFTYTNTTSPGTDVVKATFTDSSGTHNSNQSLITWIQQSTTVTYTGSTTSDFNDPTNLSATLRDSNGAPIAGQTLTFTIPGQSCSGTTDANGQASCAITPNQMAGSYTVMASFAGTPRFQPSSASTAFTVTREETTLAYTGDLNIANGGTAHASAVLKEDGQTAIPGRTVSFTLGSGASAQSCSGVTDATGTAGCTISPVKQPLGPGTVAASFAGDGFYRPASDRRSTLLFAFLGRGAFVIGDRNAVVGSRVEFWGAQWAKMNSLSGGAAPRAFKGFADMTSKPPRCGAGWSTDPGNSSAPPKSVPSFMGVIVSSSVTMSGSIISGNTPAIVIVKTDPGYAPNPGHAGKGTVVAVLCHM